jgi:peptidoglycan hydrolase-like protein with peptidoglycan-binding domain
MSSSRLGIERPENDGALIETSLDVQQALNALGFDPGPLDGIPGPLTRDAVVQFQAEHNLDPDGIAGPKTRRVLETMVRALSAKP